MSPAADGRGPAEYRKHVGGIMVTRALQRAAAARNEGKEQMAKTHVTMKVNGAEVEGLVEPRTLLVHFMRENLSLTGTHIGCETTHCGACTVDIDGIR